MLAALAFAAGILLGAASGLVPGLHPNLAVSVLDSMGIDGGILQYAVVSMYAANIVFAFIPSVFFGIPEDASVVSALAGQRLALAGRGMTALGAMVSSAVAAGLISSALFIISLDFYASAYPIIRPYLFHILLALSAILVLKSRAPAPSLAVFALSGALGKLTLDSGMPDPFLPLFSGMFAMAAILGSGGSRVPEQEEEPAWDGFIAYSALGVILGMLANLLPGIGSPAQIAAIATLFIPLESLGYLAAVSAISVSQAVLSLSSAASIGKARSGVTVWLMENPGMDTAMLLAAFMAGLLISAAAVHLMRRRIAALGRLDMRSAGILLASGIAAATLAIDGPGGIGVLICSCGLGILALRLGATRINLMGAIIVPTLMLLLRI